MAKIWGPKNGDDRQTGELSEDEAYAYVVKQVGEGQGNWPKNARKAIRAIQEHTGKGGGTDFTDRGKTIFHVSEGTDITLFFKSDGNIASIVGIGHHIGASAYEVEWKSGNWTNDKRITL
jgi:hypothetical protein